MTKAFSFKNVVKIYRDFQLGPLSFDLAPGVVLGYIGPNASGKTTTMHCLVGLVRADSGEMEIFGRRNDLNHPAWKLDTGYVGDEHVFYENWTGERNLRFLAQFYPSWSNEIVSELARRFNLPLQKKAKELSHGNRVKLALISALAHSPKLLILDEPTSGLDPVVRAEVLEVLFEVVESGERAIFYSTHILSDISRLADELAFLSEGQILLRTTKEDLTDLWRKISFRLEGGTKQFAAAVQHRQEGQDHQIITADFEATRRHLAELGAENVMENRMSIDEIAVHILLVRSVLVAAIVRRAGALFDGCLVHRGGEGETRALAYVVAGADQTTERGRYAFISISRQSPETYAAVRDFFLYNPALAVFANALAAALIYWQTDIYARRKSFLV